MGKKAVRAWAIKFNGTIQYSGISIFKRHVQCFADTQYADYNSDFSVEVVEVEIREITPRGRGK